MSTIKRAKIVRDDLALWDGVNKTITRVDATGGTFSGLTVGDYVDVLQVFGEGDQYTVAAINAALDFVGSNTATLLWSSGTWVIDDNVTIPATIANHVTAGCVFAVSTTKTLTFSGPVHVEYSSATGTGWYTLAGTGDIQCSVGASGFPGW